MFDSFNANLRKNEGFLTSIPRIPIPEYGQSNAPLICVNCWFQFTVLPISAPALERLDT